MNKNRYESSTFKRKTSDEQISKILRYKIILEVYLPLFKDNQILLLKRQNTGYEDGNYSFIAGHVEEGETIRQAMVRESYEEAGITIKIEDLKLVHTMHRGLGATIDEPRLSFYFTASDWQGEIKNCEPEKCEELKWFNLNNLPVNLIPTIAQFIENYQKQKLYSEIGWEKHE